jgi:hypothetical protein
VALEKQWKIPQKDVNNDYIVRATMGEDFEQQLLLHTHTLSVEHGDASRSTSQVMGPTVPLSPDLS